MHLFAGTNRFMTHAREPLNPSTWTPHGLVLQRIIPVAGIGAEKGPTRLGRLSGKGDGNGRGRSAERAHKSLKKR